MKASIGNGRRFSYTARPAAFLPADGASPAPTLPGPQRGTAPAAFPRRWRPEFQNTGKKFGLSSSTCTSERSVWLRGSTVHRAKPSPSARTGRRLSFSSQFAENVPVTAIQIGKSRHNATSASSKNRMIFFISTLLPSSCAAAARSAQTPPRSPSRKRRRFCRRPNHGTSYYRGAAPDTSAPGDNPPPRATLPGTP